MDRSMKAALHDAGRLLRLAAPVVVVQLGMMMLGVVDLLFVGRISKDALEAASLGNLWIFGTTMLGMGIVLGIDPLVSQAHGAGDGEGAGLALQRGLVLAALLAPIFGLLWWWTEPALLLFQQKPHLAALAGEFARVQVLSPVGFLGFIAFREYLQGRNITMPAVYVMLAANVVNAVLNWMLIPRYGLPGSGIATAITRMFMLGGVAAVVFGFGLHRGAWARWSRASFDPKGLATVLALGVPVGIQYSLEVWAFQITTIWSGWLPEKGALGAHSVVLNLASVSFMVPLGIAIAASITVGNRIGEGDLAGARRGARVALALGAAVMSVSALAFLALRRQLPSLYVPGEPEVIALAASILPIAAAFQLFDGTQVVGGAILRGMGIPRFAAFFNVVGYYLIALPLAYWMAFPRGMGLAGLWWGLALGLALIAISLVAFVTRVQPKRVKVQEPVVAPA